MIYIHSRNGDFSNNYQLFSHHIIIFFRRCFRHFFPCDVFFFLRGGYVIVAKLLIISSDFCLNSWGVFFGDLFTWHDIIGLHIWIFGGVKPAVLALSNLSFYSLRNISSIASSLSFFSSLWARRELAIRWVFSNPMEMWGFENISEIVCVGSILSRWDSKFGPPWAPCSHVRRRYICCASNVGTI